MSDKQVRSLILAMAWSRSGKLQQVEVGVGDHDVIGLSAHPSSHVDIAVRRPRAGRVHVQADAGLALLAVAAAAAGDVEGHRNEVAHFHELDVAPGLDDLTGYFVPEDEPRGAVVRPRTMCWSLPQILVLTTLRTTPWSQRRGPRASDG